jgi:hypothetical protein
MRLPFVIDTGATDSSISQEDLAMLGRDQVRRLGLQPAAIPLVGIGGEVTWWQFFAGLRFSHSDGEKTLISLPLGVIDTHGIPSVIGRDVLSSGVFTVDGPSGSFTLDLPQGPIR